MPEPKAPVMPSVTIRAEGPYTSCDLGKLLLKMAEGNKTLTLTREKHHEYVRGLRDAHMMEARQLYDMLCTVKTVEVTFYLDEED